VKNRFNHEEAMPLYEYRCEACGESEEKLQGLSAPDHHPCPNCGAAQGMQRQVSVASFALSGSGWFASGYGKEKGAKAPESAAPKVSESTPAKPTEGGGCCGGCACH